MSRVLATYYRGPDHPMKLRLWRYIRQFLHYAPLTIAYGNRAWISIDERDWLQSSIFASGAYEPEVWAALAHHATGDDVVWDVGANIGSFVLTAAQDQRVKSVCAFEPDPVTLEALTRNLALNGNPAVVVYPFALSDAAERKTLIHGPSTNTGMSTLSPTAHTGITSHLGWPEQLPTFEIDCRTADELIARGEAPLPTLMKIDVEGWEYQVLNGAHRLLQSTRLKALAFEACSDATGRLQDDRLERLLLQHHYTISHIRRLDGELRGVENYLAVPQ